MFVIVKGNNGPKYLYTQGSIKLSDKLRELTKQPTELEIHIYDNQHFKNYLQKNKNKDKQLC